MKKCPFCAELIQDEAIKCKHCGEFLDGRVRPSQASACPDKPKENFFARMPWFIGFCIVGPFVLPMIWANPKYSQLKKQVLTVIVAGLTIWIIWLSIGAVKAILAYYKQMTDMFQGMY